MNDRRELVDLLLFLGAFTALSVAVMAAPVGLAGGWRLTALVLVWWCALPAFALRRGHADWIAVWPFLAATSVFQVLPDWFLAEGLGVLVFPDDGSPRIGAVSAYMAGLWTIPLFLTWWCARAAAERRGEPAGTLVAGLVALLIFGASEAFSRSLLGSWYAKDVTMWGDVALYVLVPEALLGIATWTVAERTMTGSPGSKLAGGLAVAGFYTGCVALAWMFVERVSWS